MSVVVRTPEEMAYTGAGIPWVNASGVESDELDGKIERVGREIANWVSQTRGTRRASLFNRAAYVAPDNPFSQMKTARSAVDNDDIVGGVCDVAEGLMFQGLKWESEDAFAADIFNQIARDLNLDEFARQWHREDYTHSQVVIGLWWGMKEYTFRGKTEKGKKSKRKATIAAPLAWTFLDPQKVVPLKPGPFGQDRLAWHATKEEFAASVALQADPYGDPVLREFTLGPLKIDSREEIEYLESLGIDHRRLLALNPASVFRFCRTKMSYDRFPAVRLKSVFPLLDLKQQLIEADRVSLIGAANFILLVRQGSKDEPATQEEIDNLKDNFKVVAKLPVVVGDHRLSIDIITPDQTMTLAPEKYDTIDRRILNRCLGALTLANSGKTSDTGLTVTRGIARLLENRRHMMKRALEEQVARRIVDHPLNNGLFEHEPNLAFTPRTVQLDSDGEVARSVLALRTQNELSRESTLEYFGFDQAVEAMRREFEAENYDDTFQTRVPFSADPNGTGGGEPSQVSGARGGRPPGGGDSPQSPQGQTGRRSSRGNKS